MTNLYGIMAEFDQPKPLIKATKEAYKAGYRKMEAYTPFPIEELTDALGQTHSKLPLLVFFGGVIGGVTGFGMQYLSMAEFYPYLVAGKPAVSWPAFIPVTFEMTVLVAALTAVIAMFALNGLPQPYHPVFNAPNFEKASLDKFFLCIEADDSQFDATTTTKFLQGLDATNISEVSRSPEETGE